MTSTLSVWRTLRTEGEYRYHIQLIRHLEHANMCNGLELRFWININPIWYVIFISSTRPTQGEHERRTIRARSINNSAVLRKFTSSLVTRVTKCIQADGGHIEQFACVLNGQSVTVHLISYLNKCTMFLPPSQFI